MPDGSANEVDVLVKEGSYHFHSMVFPDNIMLTLDGDGVEWVLTDESEVAGPTAFFIAGQSDTDACDLGCSENWLEGQLADLINFNSSSLPPAMGVPCTDRSAGIPAGYHTRLVAHSVYTFENLIWGSSGKISDISLIPALQIFPPGNVRVNTMGFF